MAFMYGITRWFVYVHSASVSYGQFPRLSILSIYLSTAELYTNTDFTDTVAMGDKPWQQATETAV